MPCGEGRPSVRQRRDAVTNPALPGPRMVLRGHRPVARATGGNGPLKERGRRRTERGTSEGAVCVHVRAGGCAGTGLIRLKGHIYVCVLLIVLLLSPLWRPAARRARSLAIQLLVQ